MGKHAAKEGMRNCDSCPAGLSSTAKAVKCFECPAGHHTPKPGMACRKCPENTYSNKGAGQTGSTSCAACPSGKLANPGSDRCTDGARCSSMDEAGVREICDATLGLKRDDSKGTSFCVAKSCQNEDRPLCCEECDHNSVGFRPVRTGTDPQTKKPDVGCTQEHGMIPDEATCECMAVQLSLMAACKNTHYGCLTSTC